MTHLRWPRALRDWLLGHRPDPPASVDLREPSRRHAIAEAEYQAAADAASAILRVSGKVAPPVRRVPGVVVREKVRS